MTEEEKHKDELDLFARLEGFGTPEGVGDIRELPSMVPPAPTNVRIHRNNGDEDPVETVYSHTDADGMRVWKAIIPISFAKGMDSIKCDQLPPRTEVHFDIVKD